MTRAERAGRRPIEGPRLLAARIRSMTKSARRAIAVIMKFAGARELEGINAALAGKMLTPAHTVEAVRAQVPHSGVVSDDRDCSGSASPFVNGVTVAVAES